MKHLLILLISLLFMNASTAQENQSSDVRYKKYAGRYGSSSGISLFEDGTYLLYGYATGVFGSYRFEKDNLVFTADKQPLFEVFGCYNPSLANNTRINFRGFERSGSTFIQFNKEMQAPIFNENPNCFDHPFVFLKTEKLLNFTLSAVAPTQALATMPTPTSWIYLNEKQWNDFILVYNAPQRAYEDFSAVIISTENGEMIKLSNYGGDGGYKKQTVDEDEQRQWKEILDWKQQYDQSKLVTQNHIFANKHYNVFAEPASSQYNFDKKSNLFSAKDAKENEVYEKDNQYNDPRYLRKYERLNPQTKKVFKLGDKLAAKSIFFTVCGEGAENSYHYQGYIKYPQQKQQSPTTVAPVKITNQ